MQAMSTPPSPPMRPPGPGISQACAQDPRWQAVLARDAGADGAFCYALAGSPIYCRPSCVARQPAAQRICYFDDAEQAEQAGYRACKRCNPKGPSLAQQHREVVLKVCGAIDAAEAPPALQTLADGVGMSPFHLHRIFKAITGITPKAYAQAQRGQKLRHALASAPSVTQAIYGAGYNSNGRFYEASNQLLGMTPSNYRRGGRDTTIRFALGQCSLGAILVAASERGICAIWMGDDPQALLRELQERFAQAQLVGADAQFEQLVAQVVGLVETPDAPQDLPLDIRGTAFQQRVWQALRDIPAGSTLSYTELAQRIGAPSAVRAVASACAANALAVAIPCHRVVRSNGELSGYRWGVARKRALLAREAKD